MAPQWNTPGVGVAFNNILDTFTGADGGVRFAKLMWFLADLDVRASNGDKDAEEVLKVVIRMSRLIDITNAEKPK
jgi:hypothetical protein